MKNEIQIKLNEKYYAKTKDKLKIVNIESGPFWCDDTDELWCADQLTPVPKYPDKFYQVISSKNPVVIFRTDDNFVSVYQKSNGSWETLGKRVQDFIIIEELERCLDLWQQGIRL